MAREVNRLTARSVVAIKDAGRHADGSGLYLVVDKGGAKRWVFMFRFGGRLREMGLGGLRTVTLAQAREAAAAARTIVKAGRNPIDERHSVAPRLPTFGEAADSFLATMKPQFKNAKHVAQWETSLTVHSKPMRDKPVDEITTEDVLGVLRPIWHIWPETASRVRGRIERVLNAAKAQGHRSGENPALWRGHLDNLLPRPKKLTRGHHAAMSFAEVPSFVAQLRARPATAARMLEFVILTAARSGEAREATWREIDLAAKVWTVPAARMKAGREHRVPLGARAVEILQEMAAAGIEPERLVFPGQKDGKPLSIMAMDMLLRRLSADVTVHGFRSAFRDWCGEATDFSRELAEAALAHVVGDMTERAYRRGDALEKRRALMDAWAAFCAEGPGASSA